MAYGERRGVHKLPGDYSIADLFGFGLAGALGIIAAIMADMTQSDETSALFTLNRWFSYLGEMFGLGDPPLYIVILILMGIGALSVFYFQPVTLQGAFAQGFGVLAAVMTVAPADLGNPAQAPDMPTIIEEAETTASMPQAKLAGFVGSMEGMAMRGSMQNAVYTPRSVRGGLQAVAFQQETDKYNLTITINVPEGLKNRTEQMISRGNIRGRIHNSVTSETYNLFRNSGAIVRPSSDGQSIMVMTGIPGTANTAKLYARIEIAGYEITVEEFTATRGRNNDWTITMTPSNTPLTLQRLGQSYWF